MANPIIIEGKKISKWRASFLLVKESWRFLRADKELVLVPVVSSLLSCVLLGILTSVAVLSGVSIDILFAPEMGIGATQFVFALGVYIIGAFTLAISQATTTHIVYVRAHGGNATLGQGFARAFDNVAPLLLWALISGSIGTVLRFISDKSELIGKIISGLLGAAWSVMTFFVVPIILIEKKDSLTAIKQSAVLFKKTWGESLISNITLGLAFLLAHILAWISFFGVLIIGVKIGNGPLIVGAVLCIFIWFVVAVLIQNAMQGIVKTLLYIFAAEGVVPPNFNRELLENMLVRNSESSKVGTTSAGTELPSSNN
jgi:hypothetical protein